MAIINHTKKLIQVYADWQEIASPQLMGVLQAAPAKGKESFSFEYSQTWLASGFSHIIDPDLELFAGAFYPKDEKQNFGLFLDSCPDRWGRVLMQRREAAYARKENRPAKKLMESDFLLGVYDGHRMGALRFKTNEQEAFLNDNKEMATPPWTSLAELEHASLRFEGDDIDSPDYLKWINMLIAPGSSLGGARPKASVVDKNGQLWIAKFPSKNDDKDMAAWEMVVNELGIQSGLNMAKAKILKFNNRYHTYLTKRFDRTDTGSRIHFASAMTLLGHTDGENSEGASYLEMVELLTQHGAFPTKDLEELWRRIVFSICVKNTDDHLRNHGFILIKTGWTLSPAYDINPNEYGKELSLNISSDSNALDLNLAIEVAPYFLLAKTKANQIINQVKNAVSNWEKVAIKYKIAKAEQQRMEAAFVIG